MHDREMKLTVVVPVFNEEGALEVFHAATAPVLASLTDDYEILFVDDGSTDGTLARVEALREADPRVSCVVLSRNFGKEIALSAGLDHARGDAVVVMDVDLQDPPELIVEFVARWREGFDVVYGERVTREGETFLKKATARAFYRVIGRFADIEIPANVGDFRLLSRPALDAVRKLRERHRFMKGVFSWIGFRRCAIPYVRKPRASGETKWNYPRLWKLALEGIIGYSYRPLQLASLLGLFVSLFAFLYGGYLLFRTLIRGIELPGYASIMVTILFLGGVQLLTLGIIGEYIGRISSETRNRPMYLVRKVLGDLTNEGEPGG